MKRVFFLVIMLCVLAPCASPGGELTLFAAASLKDALNELSDSYARTHPGVTFKKNYGASGALARQIENGAPADIFISANTEWMDYLKNKKLADEKSIGTLAYNVLVFAGRPELKIGRLQDLLKLGRIAIGSPKSVPAGEYAMEALKKAGMDKQLEKKLIMARDVRECLMYAERGEVDGAFVYRTDALQAKQARILFVVPRELYPRVVYPMAITRSGAMKPETSAFHAMLQSAEAKAVLKKYGFMLR